MNKIFQNFQCFLLDFQVLVALSLLPTQEKSLPTQSNLLCQYTHFLVTQVPNLQINQSMRAKVYPLNVLNPSLSLSARAWFLCSLKSTQNCPQSKGHMSHYLCVPDRPPQQLLVMGHTL